MGGVLQRNGDEFPSCSDNPDRTQKRKFQDEEATYGDKRSKVKYNGGVVLESNIDGLDRISPKNNMTDRNLMPPPSSPLNHKRTKRASLETAEIFSEAHTQKTKVADIDTDYDMEAARRRAAATQLPANSGTWEPAEQDLFFHLAYRGFEPLLSQNWMRDFPTLPLSLFATQMDQTPLINFHRSTEFRAIKALRELIDTGKVIRDRVMAPDNGLRSEPIIERAANKYIKWSLRDVGISKKQCVPVHAIASMKPGQTTHDVIRELTIKMHKHSARHRKECDILTSIERNEDITDATTKDQTRLSEDELDIDHKLPVIYGLMICSSLIAVFTLSSHTPPPRFVVDSMNTNKHDIANEDGSDQDQDEDNEDSGLRFIASFDFSDSASDVWNAFVIAILAMMIRKSLLEIYEVPASSDDHDVDESILEPSLLDDNDGGDDDRNSRYIARYAGGSAAQSSMHDRRTINEEEAIGDDPDL